MLAAQGLLWLGLAVAGHAALYWLWIAAWLTTFSLFMRVRSIAEHACTERSPQPLLNTRTTRASLLARATVAPHQVNFHLEHHLLMTVPFFRLRQVHRRLRECEQLPPQAVASGYWRVLKLAVGES